MTAKRRTGPDVRLASFATPKSDTTKPLRVVPLLEVMGDPGHRVVVTGATRIVVTAESTVALSIEITNAWSERNHAFTALDIDAEDFTAVRTAIKLSIADDMREPSDDPQSLAARIAKGLAERSRNSVARIREIRYELESLLAQANAPKKRAVEQVSVVSSLLQLNIITSRAADVAREAVREGLWVWTSDSAAYHSYRRLQDPLIINEHKPATATTRSWMRQHDAAVRQCLEMRKQLDAESTTVQSLLAAASSVSSSREADAQSSFNTLAAAASLGLGLPALVLSLYGADRLVPLISVQRWIAFAPVVVGLLLAAILAISSAPRGKTRVLWLLGATGILVAVGVLLLVAGTLAPV